MKRLGVLVILAGTALFALQVFAQEGRVQNRSSAQLAPDRVAKYRGESGQLNKETAPAQKQHSAVAEKQESSRPSTVALAEKSQWFRIYDAGSRLKRDRDRDGHHSEFEIRFDADSRVGDARVYAKLYLRRVGDGGRWIHYHTTDDFWIFGESGSDDYYVATTLHDGFPTGHYDVLIDLYEVGYSGIVATLTAYDDASLADLPLEERGLDIPYGLPGFSILGVNTALLVDADRDGFYSKFRIAFDPDTDFGPAYVYAVIWVRAPGGEWIKEHESDDFLVDMSGTADVYSFTADWLSGYPTAEYDLQLDLYDAATGLLVASAGSERPAFARIPLEDATRDRVAGPPVVVVSNSVTTSREHGGSLSLWMALTLGGLAAAQARRSRLRFSRRPDDWASSK